MKAVPRNAFVFSKRSFTISASSRPRFAQPSTPRLVSKRSSDTASAANASHAPGQKRTLAHDLNVRSDQLRDELFAVLGRDFSAPVGALLASTLQIPSELPTESRQQLDRLITSGFRMQRMLEQLIDVTCDAVGEVVRVERVADQDIALITKMLAEELRQAHPERQIDVIDRPCCVSVDRTSIERVLRTLLGNALTHGAADRPVRVSLDMDDRVARIEVQNGGAPIDEDVRAHLFDPSRPAKASLDRSEGLGLGLYIAKRIVTAHGGELDVESSAELGARFLVTWPRDAALSRG